MQKYIPLAFEINLRPEGFVFEVNSLIETLCGLHDHRDARGIRYALVTLLLFMLLAKFAGESQLRGIAQWVKRRAVLLADFLALAKPQAPHAITYSRALSKALAIDEFEKVVREFFARQPGAGQSVLIALDGKVLRGTIPAGQTRGVYLFAAYLPAEGYVCFQVEVGRKENEIPAAGRGLKCLDLPGKIITGDALLAQRELSTQIVRAEGDYVWIMDPERGSRGKDNQPETLADLERLFAPEPCTPGFSPASHDDFQTDQTAEKRHGRIERRSITVSSALQDYLDWPGLQQVFKLERHVIRVRDGRVSDEVVYGVSSLTAQEASPARLLYLVREHWQIENGLHYRRDDTLKEDRCTLRRPQAAHAMSVLNNLVLGLLVGRGVTNVPDARRDMDADPKQGLDLLLKRP